MRKNFYHVKLSTLEITFLLFKELFGRILLQYGNLKKYKTKMELIVLISIRYYYHTIVIKKKIEKNDF